MNPIVFYKIASRIDDVAMSAIGRAFKARKAPRPISSDGGQYSSMDPNIIDIKRKEWGILGAPVSGFLDWALKKSRIPPGSVTAPERGDALAFLRNIDPDIHKSRNFSPQDRRMINAIVEKHELDEQKYKRGMSMRSFGHASTPVILNEHNASVAVRNQGHPMVANIFHNMRSGGEENIIKRIDPRYVHGESPRYSRHAIRRMSEIAERNAPSLPWYQRMLGGE